MASNFWKSKCWTTCAIGLLCFAAGLLVASRLSHIQQARADSNRVFELRVYHALPGKLPALESRFRDTTSKILVRHNLNAVGYWVTDGASASDNEFIWIAAYSSLEEGKKDWAAMRADPEFQKVISAEQTEKTVEKVDVTYMRPTDFSPLK
ncbi:MAG TPA: NIPSNAP family protein [Terriglobales bacterium]|nr:NIPSNAP family protein [Terriglobales bacterium]